MQTPSSGQKEETPLLNYLHSIHGKGATISLETFIEAALYAPNIGYYTRSAQRVGYREGRDFYTAESLGSVFRRLLTASCLELLGDDAKDYGFTELGAEPGEGLLANATHPFNTNTAFGCKEPFQIAGPQVLFSNELFDAQPFRRFEFREGNWREHGVLLADGGFEPTTRTEASSTAPPLPKSVPDGYILDDPSGARRLIERIAEADWHGLFIAFDYGLDRETLHQTRPSGTGRTYRDHRMGSDLLAHPGQTDLTHHICWDDLSEALERDGFTSIKLQAQESFFVHHGAKAMAEIIESGAQKGLNRDLQTLKELLHPEHMGRKFQVLTAFRAKNTCQGSGNAR